MTKEEAEVYKEEYSITSPAEWNEEEQKWDYSNVTDKMKLSGDAQGLRVSREQMQKLYEWFPDKDEEYSNKPLYTHREMNRVIRAAIAQNYKRL